MRKTKISDNRYSVKSVRLNMIYQMIYRALTLLTPLITTPYLARTLGANGIGLFSFSASILSYFTMIAYLGIDNYGTRTIAQARASNSKEIVKERFWEVFSVQLFTSLLAIILFVAYFFLFIHEHKNLYIIQSLALISALVEVNWFFSGMEEFQKLVSRNCIIKLLTVVCILLFIKAEDDVTLYTLIIVLGNVFSSGVMWLFIINEFGLGRPTTKNFRIHLRQDLILFVPVIAVTVYHTMDKTMLGLLSNYVETGYYYNADKLINLPLGMITGTGIVLLPRMSNILAKNDVERGKDLIGKSTELFVFLSCAMSLGICSIAKEFVPFFFGDGFEPCVILVYIFTPVLIIKSLSNLIQTQLLIPSNNEKIYIIATFSGAFVNVVLNSLLIPKTGALGAAIGTLFAEGVVLFVEARYIREKYSIVKYFCQNTIYLFAGLVMMAMVRGSSSKIQMPLFGKVLTEIVIGALVYLLIVSVYWLKNDRSIFHGLTTKCISRITRK